MMSSTIYNQFNDFPILNTNSNSMKLDENVISKFRIAKQFTENKARINSIDFSQDGRNLITSSDDDTIILYDCEKGVKKRDIMSKKYGVDLIKFTHANNTAIHTSTKENDTIRYLSLHDNKYLRYFMGHEDRVVTLAMSPADDTFLSGSLDQTIKLWDLNQDKPAGNIKVGSPACANFDPEGLIFAVGLNNDTIKLFDSRSYGNGPFHTIKYDKPPANFSWKSLKFSPNGKQILITTNLEQLFILDAFTCHRLQTLETNSKLSKPPDYVCEGCYTPDSQFILCGSVDGTVYVWNSTGDKLVTQLKPDVGSSDPVQCVMFSPKHMLMASACSKLSFWDPRLDEL